MNRRIGRSCWRPAVLLALTAVLSACGSGEPEDIRAWMKESTKDLKAKIPELPKINPLPVPVYEPGEALSPFSIGKLTSDSAMGGSSKPGPKAGVNPDAHPLVRVPIETIRLLGTLRVGKDLVAVVASDRNAVYRVRVGDYLGQGYGRITAIHPATQDADAEVLVKETVMEKGMWVERDNRVAAPSQGEKK
ncbi:pilus assembly protein PilP [Denitratisoma oestradiolicum]|uniref:Putative Pilus assembly protein PilP n=1 Tax=Denitratisoma oestradiolicum TaxID=311182 RepID=A0A6S6XUT7_9PROT|nr:pilus assembly protein PilP [Denitratisoma oestradiolicum]TWO80024.1 hypothetical protein CBW56_11960 [Denitratisoma oestradiolicum]CAB1369792.1 putative Pilus assembly protein PilP [Denitratisoma oestradiolicum]